MRESDREGRIMIKVIKKDGTKETDFIPIEVIGKAAEFCANYLSKGRLIAAQGSIKVDRYQTQEGENRTFTCARRKLRSQICIMWSKVH